MMRLMFGCVVFMMMVSIAPARAAGPSDPVVLKDPAVFIARSSELSQKLNSIEADFAQTKHLSFFSEDITSKGKFYFRKENLVRWEYTSPFTYIMVMNQDKFYVKDKNKVSTFDVKSNKMIAEINDIMLSCIKGSILKERGKFVIAYYESNAVYLVKLKPLSSAMAEFLQGIELSFSKSTLFLTEMRMIEHSGDYTNIVFRNKKTNEPIADEKFSVK